jgi:hypothetical protein
MDDGLVDVHVVCGEAIGVHGQDGMLQDIDMTNINLVAVRKLKILNLRCCQGSNAKSRIQGGARKGTFDLSREHRMCSSSISGAVPEYSSCLEKTTSVSIDPSALSLVRQT